MNCHYASKTTKQRIRRNLLSGFLPINICLGKTQFSSSDTNVKVATKDKQTNKKSKSGWQNVLLEQYDRHFNTTKVTDSGALSADSTLEQF
ncbi:hypothetical protein TNCV_3622281 [Trichonephila clavipes]|nr:hypothetical protein TNCV_3622281 [Trichonephila clavipes]